MAVTIDGNLGVTSPDFEPSSSTVPTNGLFLPATNALGFATNSTERVRIDSSGNVGIGTSSPGTKLEVNGAVKVATANWFAFGSDNTFYSDSSYGLVIKAPATSNFIAFRSSNDTERARIDSSGNLLVGTTSLVDYGRISINFASNGPNIGIGIKQTNSGSGTLLNFFAVSTQIGSITNTGSNTVSFNSTSDKRLKKNIVDSPNALDSVNAIKIRSFDWKEGGFHVDYGYIAQELLEVAPEVVSVPADPEEMMGVDFGKLTPRLVKAIQELTARLEALENK